MNDTIYDLKMKSIIANTQRIQSQTPSLAKKNEPSSFDTLLQDRIKENSKIEFSKHAIDRVAQRSIELENATLDRLNHGVALAQAKGLNSPLILVDQTAFVVNVSNNKVITTLSDDALKGSVFTNIDGTVIV